MKDSRVVRWCSCGIVALVILFTGIASAHAAAPTVSDSGSGSQKTLSESSLLQFNAGGHILGFKPDKVYFASWDHAIVEEFLGTMGVMPVGEAGQGSTEGKKGAPGLGKVVYKNLWRGITLKYEAKNNGIAESTYVLEPGADVTSIRLKYNVSVGIEKNGSLRFRHPSDKGTFSESAPKAWQEIAGKRMPVEVAFADYGDNTIGFRLGQYNRQYAVIMDPTYQWHAFYGGAGSDYGVGIAVDTSGNVYMTGSSTATWNGPGATAPLNPYSGSSDIVVMKLNSAGTYQWHTFYGSVAGGDSASRIAVDSSSGNVYVSATSGATWNAGVTAPLNPYSGNNDIVVLKLNSAGAYQWHTFYGGVGGGGNNDYGRSLSVDSGGNVYVTGNSNTAWNGPGPTAPLNAYSGGNDIVVLKLDSAGAYLWHTFYGAVTGHEYGRGIVVDSSSGNVYVAGDSTATWNGPGATAPLNPYSGSHDIVVLKLNSAGAYLWHTFYGSVAGWDEAYSIAMDSGGNVYVAGDSDATWNGPGATAPLNPYSGAADIVVLKLDSGGAYQWHTFYGSVAGNDYDNGIAVDSGGSVYVSGYSYAAWNAGVAPPLNAYSGGTDIVVLKLSTGGAYQWHTFYGSAGTDVGSGIAVDSGRNVYVTGNGNATWNAGVTAPLNAYSGNYDIVVLRLAQVWPTITTTSPVTNITSITATAGGNVTSDGGTTVTERGTCYSTAANPTTPCTSDGTGTGSFTSSLTGLTPSTPYHVRAYATNAEGTAYGSDVSFTTTLIAQAIIFTNPGSRTVGAAPFALSASGGGSGNPVTFASQTNSVCTVSGSTATLVAAGTCTIAADQAGNASYAAAAQVVQSFTVNALIAQTINFTNPGSRTVGAAPFALSASGGASGNSVTFASQTNSVCTVSGSTATLVAAGTCTITADQAGNASYAAAPQVVQSFSVSAALGAPEAIPTLSGRSLLMLAALLGLLGMAMTRRSSMLNF